MAGLGHQLDADTLILYKMDDPTLDDVYSGTDSVVEETGNYPLTPVGATVVPHITWGPFGTAKRTQFARYFHAIGNNCRLRSNSVIDQAFIDAQITDHTWEFLFKTETVATSDSMFAVSGPTGTGIANDWLIQINTSGGGLNLFWENNDTNERIQTSATNLWSDETWHALTIRRRPDPGDVTKYEIRIYADGVFVQEFSQATAGPWAEGNGLMPASNSGTAARIQIGQGGESTAQGDFLGTVAQIRCVELLLTDQQIADNAAELLATGEIGFDSHGGGTTLCHWKLDDEPGLIDETELGLHGNRGGAVYTGTDGRKKVDLIGTGGTSFNYNGGNIASFPLRMNARAFSAAHGRDFLEFFNDTIDVPEWTISAWLLLPANGLGAERYLINLNATGESLATNFVARVGLTTGLAGANFWERGSGANTGTNTPSPVFNVAEPTESRGKAHFAVRMIEDPGIAGNVLVEFFVNGVKRGTTPSALPPQGGTSIVNLVMGNWDGWLQEYKLSKVARTDQEILDDFNNCVALGENQGLLYRMRARDGTLARDVYWDANVVDAAGAKYGGPGPLSNVVVSKILEP